MKNIQKVLFLTLLLSIFLIGLVSAANTVTLTRPAASAIVLGASYVINATLDTNTLNLTRANFYYDTGSANVSIANNVSNVTNTLFNTTWDTTAINDVEDLTIWVEVTNETFANQTDDSSLTVDIDNGDPTSAFNSSSFADQLSLIPSTTFLSAIGADSAIGISSCNLYFTSSDGSIVTKQAVSASSNACTYSTTPTTLGLGTDTYSVVMEATDANGDAVNSSARSLIVTPTSAGGSNGGSSGDSVGVEQSQIGEKISGKVKGFGEAIMNTFRNIGESIANFFRNIFGRGQ